MVSQPEYDAEKWGSRERESKTKKIFVEVRFLFAYSGCGKAEFLRGGTSWL